jgi:hypothetical protein
MITKKETTAKAGKRLQGMHLLNLPGFFCWKKGSGFFDCPFTASFTATLTRQTTGNFLI